MEELFEVQFKYERQYRDKIVYRFAAAQGSRDKNVFSYHWQCFAWAAIVGFLTGKPKKLENALADRSFSLKAMRTYNGERIAEALICLCIAKAGTVDILKTPESAIELINEYANAGFYKLSEMLDDNPVSGSDLQWVLQEIFSRDVIE